MRLPTLPPYPSQPTPPLSPCPKTIYDRQDSNRHDSEGDGSSKRPHWRRGHFRRQFFGHARSYRKLIFIKPLLVNAHRFEGDPADTEYRLRLVTPI
jgi:hypothetical protein